MHSLCSWLAGALIGLVPCVASAETAKPAISLDEYLTTTDISSARLSPDGSAAVIATDEPDWKNSVYRHDLWIWTAKSGLVPLTHSAGEEDARWSPDGKWIAFLSDRSLPGDDASSDAEPGTEATKPKRVWIISATGGEPLPLYSEKLDAHTFAWSSDSSAIYFSTQQPLDHDEVTAREAEWQDVIRWREQNRGDLLLKLDDRARHRKHPVRAPAEWSRCGQDRQGPGRFDFCSAASDLRHHPVQKRSRHRRDRSVTRRQIPGVLDRPRPPPRRESCRLRNLSRRR